ncbi:MAG TPA: glycoside hydrolase family 2 protein [Opitutaceae bacterium]|nr:glycoside hydrolase family 2 protein [Opitutaceae bacterium]
MRSFPLASVSWRFRDATEGSRWREAIVPGCVHRDLRRHDLIPDPFWGGNELSLQWIEEHDWEYSATFDVPAALIEDEHVELVADGLDTVATVRLNGRIVGHGENMFVAHRWDVKRWIRAGRNELTIRFDSAMRYIRSHRLDHQPKEFNDPVGRSQVLRKQPCQFGWDWGPRLVTAGVWRDIRLESWRGNRVESVRVTQHHGADGSVTLALEPELANPERGVRCYWQLAFDRVPVAEGTGTQIRIEHPQLWWPNGHGAQSLYHLQVQILRADGSSIGQWNRRIGLRTIQLDRHADEWGESFQFVVNGRPVFAKGANWIPAHAFVAGLGREDYARDLRSAVAAHMNMIRVWGGGVYESEDFYDLCDELGLLVWQDFMFACTIYPGDDAFVASVRAEAEQQVRRLRHRACLALWCGNNEIEGLNADLLKTPKLRADYNAVFLTALPDAVARWDSVTPYWPSSPYRSGGDNSHAEGEKRGDTHFWDVWHARHPVKDYEKWAFRFVSEFGMQSFSSPATQATFCPPDDWNIFGATMKEHQKNRGGNQIILDYLAQRFPFPAGQEALIYLSQLNQAYCMRTGVEHYRRLMPRCMGALYWQLNDCWPVTSWSSIEFTGRWKALHFIARRFFAPALASAHVPGDETATIGNYRRSDVRKVHLYTVYDAPKSAVGRLRWDLFHLDNRILAHGEKAVRLRYGESIRQKSLDLGPAIARHGRDCLYLRLALDVDGACVSEETIFLAPPRYLRMPKARTTVDLRMTGPRDAEIDFTSTGFQHRFAFDVRGIAHEASDNYFELYPQEKKTVTVHLSKAVTAARLRKLITHRSLVDAHE